MKGLICTLTDGSSLHVLWGLSRKGFERARFNLPLLREIGYKSENQNHDHLVTAVHLGDEILGHPPTGESFTEQELRRYDLNFYPKWVPDSSLHRPDGYWHMNDMNRKMTVALEVELTPKRDCDYHTVAKFYSRHEGIHRVLWFCPTVIMAKRICRLVHEPETTAKDQHCFFTLPDFEEDGWGAASRFGADLGKTVRQILGKTVGKEWEKFPSALLCDRRKRSTAFGDFFAAKKSCNLLLSATNPIN